MTSANLTAAEIMSRQPDNMYSTLPPIQHSEEDTRMTGKEVASKGTAHGQGAARAVIAMRVYFSMYYLYGAKHFERLAREIEQAHTGESRFDPMHRAYVTNAVLSSVGFLEAAINELFDDVKDGHKGFTKSLSPEHARLLASRWRDEETSAHVSASKP
jgi:hypothetical protein